MEIDWIHRPRRDDGSDGTLNLCFNALDRHVIHGRADTLALGDEPPMTFARLLEEVAAFGGVLRAFGAGPGDRVVTGLPPGRDGLVALLASLRIGAVHVLDPDAADTVVLPGASLRRGAEGEDLEWEVVLRAGRTDPAPCAEVPAAAPALVVGGRSVSTAEVLDGGTGWPYDAVATLLAGSSVEGLD